MAETRVPTDIEDIDDQGLFPKYLIKRFVRIETCGCREAMCPHAPFDRRLVYDDVDPDANYFVLRLDADPDAREALRFYAASLPGEKRRLAEDIEELMDELDDPIQRKHSRAEGPKCKLKWEADRFILECDTPEDRDRAAKALETEEFVVRVKNTGGVP